MADKYLKDPAAVLDYVFDWKALTNGTGDSDWLADDETITQQTITVSPATATLTVDSDSQTAGAVTVWLSGGTAGKDYKVTCRIVTSAGRTDERSMTLRVADR